jgi:hypothetical protein
MNARELINKWLMNSGNVIERTIPAVLKRNARLTINFDFLVHHEIMRRGASSSFLQIVANDGVSRSDDSIRNPKHIIITGFRLSPE